MKGFILAAGLGSRLKPWTDFHPKAMAPVGGIPVFKRLVDKMHKSGINDITVNVYHFADQIIDFIKAQKWNIKISDERPELLETGGAILNAKKWLEGEEPILIHNADILSNADFKELEVAHLKNESEATLLVSARESSRKLIFNDEMRLKGWHSIPNGIYRPDSFCLKDTDREFAFSGIYIVSPQIFRDIEISGWKGRFPIMDFFIDTLDKYRFHGHNQKNLEIIDIGKPQNLEKANLLYR